MKNESVKKRGLITLSLSIVILAVISFSCYPDYGLTVQDYDMVLTLYDNSVDFAQFNTYAMPDSVLHPVPEGRNDDLTRAYDDLVLSLVSSNMADLGYTRITDDSGPDPDVIILVTALKSDWQVSSYYPGGGWWYWGWYPYYPYYPYYGYSYTFSTGTFLISMIDTEDFSLDNNTAITYWGAALNGLADYDVSSGVRNRITDGINQAFAQSPYLKTN